MRASPVTRDVPKLESKPDAANRSRAPPRTTSDNRPRAPPPVHRRTLSASAGLRAAVPLQRPGIRGGAQERAAPRLWCRRRPRRYALLGPDGGFSSTSRGTGGRRLLRGIGASSQRPTTSSSSRPPPSTPAAPLLHLRAARAADANSSAAPRGRPTRLLGIPVASSSTFPRRRAARCGTTRAGGCGLRAVRSRKVASGRRGTGWISFSGDGLCFLFFSYFS